MKVFPSAGLELKFTLLRLGFVALVAALAAWAGLSTARDYLRLFGPHPDETDSRPRWHREAREAALRACTNELPGITAIIQVSVYDEAPLTSGWRAFATVDHRNEFGGISRRELSIHFLGASTGERLSAYVVPSARR